MQTHYNNKKQYLKQNTSTAGSIFLLSHMRANTSLISHILGSHPQICGYYEMHQSYRSKNDLLKQQQLLQNDKDLAQKQEYTYLFDKILHNKYEFLLENLIAESPTRDIKILVSIRPPEQSIKSIIHLFRNKEKPHSYANTEQAANYYRQRIAQLSQFCQQHKQQYYYYDANLIRIAPEETLQHIQNWLALSSPLSEQYQVFSLTGKAGAGDSSKNMQQGKIIKQQSNYDSLEIPKSLLKNIISETNKHREQIISHAIDASIE